MTGFLPRRGGAFAELDPLSAEDDDDDPWVLEVAAAELSAEPPVDSSQPDSAAEESWGLFLGCCCSLESLEELIFSES